MPSGLTHGWMSVLIGIAMVAAPGCGRKKEGPDDKAGAAKAEAEKPLADACALATKEEIETALGESVGEPLQKVTEAKIGGSVLGTCKWTASSDAAMRTVTLVLSTKKTGKPLDPEESFHVYKTSLKAAPGGADSMQEIEDLGVKAAWYEPSMTLSLFVPKFNLAVNVHQAGADPLGVAKNIAKLAIPRLAGS